MRPFPICWGEQRLWRKQETAQQGDGQRRPKQEKPRLGWRGLGTRWKVRGAPLDGGIDLGLVSGGDKRKAETSIGGLLAEGHHPVFIDQPGQIYGVAQEVRISWKVHYNSK